MAMLETIREERLEKIKKMKEKGIDPFPSKSDRTHRSADITGDYEKHEGTEVTVAGRIMSFRDFGNLSFAHIRDGSGDIQLMLRKDEIGEKIDELKLYDVGDFIDAAGTVTKTKKGEISILVKDFRMLAKSVRPLPEKWSGLKDDDVRFRKRYLDFLVNEDSKNKITKRAQILKFLRQFMWDRDFLEIENPSLELNAAGAEARPFVTHINAYDLDVYLRICAGELWQKMSTIGGFERVFEIARAYRNEGVDAEHNPEFTMLEFYWAFATIEDNIALHQELFSGMAKEITGGYKFSYHGRELDLTPPIETARYNDLFQEHAGMDLEDYEDLDELKRKANEIGVEDIEDEMGWSSTIDTIFKQKVRANIDKPVFVTHYPYRLTPLAKRYPDDHNYIQMSQMVMDTMEMCRIYGELNDPVDQVERFKEQQEAKAAGDEETWNADYEFVEAMEYGMPPQTGSGIGIDRWVKVLTDAESLREVIAYPIMKPTDESGTVDAESKLTGKLNFDFDTLFEQSGIAWRDVEIPEFNGDEYLSMSETFSQKFPTAVAGYVVVEGVSVKKSESELESFKRLILKELKGITKADIDLNRNIDSYRDMYRKMGIDWHSRRPSPEALLRRVAQGRELYSVNSMVDAYNLVVMTQQVSVGTFDLEHMELPIEIRIGEGGEEIQLIGEDDTREIEGGEVFYSDNIGPYNLDYNYRDSERTKTRLETTRVVINAEGVGEISFEQVKKALQLAAASVVRFCGGDIVKAGILRAQDVTREYPYDDKKISIVVADDIDTGIAMNVVGHLTTSVGKNADDIMGRPQYTDAEGKRHVGLSRYPVIILKAARKDVRNIIHEARNVDVLAVDYPEEAYTTRTDDELSEAIAQKEEKALEYYGVALAGDKETVEKLTKGLKLYN